MFSSIKKLMHSQYLKNMNKEEITYNSTTQGYLLLIFKFVIPHLCLNPYLYLNKNVKKQKNTKL